MKVLTVLIMCAVTLFVGCAANGIPVGVADTAPQNVSDNVIKKFIGVPLLFAIEGSAVHLNDNWVITAAHNKVLLPSDTIYHPKCDIALYKDTSNTSTTHKGLVYLGEVVYHVGYPSSLPLTVQEGVYKGEVSNPADGCVYSADSSVVAGGMSGGGVYNTKGELVGITTGIMFTTLEWKDGTKLKNPAVFMPLKRIETWIEEVTGEKLY